MTKAHSPWLSTDTWLGEILGKPAYRLSPDFSRLVRNDQAFAEIEKQLEALSIERNFIFAKVSCANGSAVEWLKKHDFCQIERNVQFARTAQPLDSPIAHTISFATQDEEEDIKRLAEKSFSYSRFHKDPEIKTGLANKLKAEWAGNFFKGTRGHAMVVAREDGRVAGFLLLLRNENQLIIDLIATDERHRSKGIGRQMISYAIASFPEAKELIVGTQDINYQAVKFYEKMGFVALSDSFTFHRHGHPRT